MSSNDSPLESIVVGAVYSTLHEEFESEEGYSAEVDRDVALMAAAGINHVMIFPMGQWNPETEGLEWKRTDYLVDRIHRFGMRFVPLLLKEEQSFTHLPIWRIAKAPGMREERDRDNGARNNLDNVDFADPRVYPLVEAYLRAVVERYGGHPALSFYNIWNEPHYSSRAPHVVERFRAWLRVRYGSLSSLGRSWGIDYSEWGEVSPFLVSDWRSSMPVIDWALFRNELIGELLGALAEGLGSRGDDHPINANPVGSHWADFGRLEGFSVDAWPIVAHEQIAGISYYPDAWERAHGASPCPPWVHHLVFTSVRSAAGEKPYILTELSTNAQSGLSTNGYLAREQVEPLAWTALANDCKGMIYWKWRPFMRGRQSLGRGLVRADGSLAPRGEAVRRLGQLMKEHGVVLREARLEKPKAAILVDMVGLLKNLEQDPDPATTTFMYESVAGVFKALDEESITVDLLRMDRGLSIADLAAYRFLFLPFQIVVRRELAQLLDGFVREGGWLVADARSATIDEYDHAYRVSPGGGLDLLFGAVRRDWTAARDWYPVQVRTSSRRTSYRFEGRFFREELEPSSGTEVIGRFADDGAPAITENRVGRGTAVLSAVPLGASYYGRPGNRAKRIILRCAQEAGAAPTARIVGRSSAGLALRVHTLEAARVVYLVNSGDREARGRLEVTVDGPRAASALNLITGRRVPLTAHGSRVALTASVPARAAMVLLIE